MAPRPIIVVAGVGNASGTGAAVARAFAAQLRYRVAVIARRQKDVDGIASGIEAQGGEARGFAVTAYDHENILRVFKEVKATWKDSRIKCCVWNASQWSMIPFLNVEQKDIERSVQINIVAAFAFAQEALRSMLPDNFDADQPQPIVPSSSPDYDKSPGGSLLLTGATSGTRGAARFATFAAGKHGLRAMSQSLAREFGPHGIHVSHVIVDGTIRTDVTYRTFGTVPHKTFTPVAKEDDSTSWMDDESRVLSPDVIAQTYLFLHQQDCSAWTLELDLRPAKEHF